MKMELKCLECCHTYNVRSTEDNSLFALNHDTTAVKKLYAALK